MVKSHSWCALKEKGTARPCQVWIGKTNASEPLMMCRKRKMTSKPGGSRYPGISSGENLLTARAASGMKVASVRFGRVHGTWEPVASMLREPSKRKTRKDLSTDARHRGGMARSSEEAGQCRGSEGAMSLMFWKLDNQATGRNQ